MRKAGRGSIINMSSISWIIPTTGRNPLRSRQAAIVGLTRTVAHEAGPMASASTPSSPAQSSPSAQKRLW